jgi:hypothetical protein
LITTSETSTSKIACGRDENGDVPNTTAQSIPIWAALSVLVPLPEKLPVTVLAEQFRGALPTDVAGLPAFGTITCSAVGTRRSEFAAILKTDGVDGLVAALNRKADILTGTTAKSF